MNRTVYDETSRKDNVLMIFKWALEKEGDEKFVSIITDIENKIIEKKEV